MVQFPETFAGAAGFGITMCGVQIEIKLVGVVKVTSQPAMLFVARPPLSAVMKLP